MIRLWPATMAGSSRPIGDGLLVEFASVVDAVACALAHPAGLTHPQHGASGSIVTSAAGRDQPGDVVVQDGDLFGEGVNVAARLERLSEPGGICLTREVRDQLQDKLKLALV